MNKQELIDSLTADVSRVVRVDRQADVNKQAVGVTTYVANVMELAGRNQLVGRNIVFYVLDEGLPSEVAYYKDRLHRPSTFLNDVMVYMDAIAVLVAYEITSISPENGYALARAWQDNGDGTATERQVILFYDGAVIAHRFV